MMNLLDIHVEILTLEQVEAFDRIAMVDVQPHYFGGAIDSVGLVIDHHPEQPGYTAIYKDIRVDYGSTSTILTEHLRAVDMNISERVATAMLYAITGASRTSRKSCRREGTKCALVIPCRRSEVARWLVESPSRPVRASTTRAPAVSGRNSSQMETSKLSEVLWRTTSSVRWPQAPCPQCSRFTTARCGTMTPLGWPVEPEV